MCSDTDIYLNRELFSIRDHSVESVQKNQLYLHSIKKLFVNKIENKNYILYMYVKKIVSFLDII